MGLGSMGKGLRMIWCRLEVSSGMLRSSEIDVDLDQASVTLGRFRNTVKVNDGSVWI